MPCSVLSLMLDGSLRVRIYFPCTRNFLLVSIVRPPASSCQASMSHGFVGERPPVRGGGDVASSPSASAWKSGSGSGEPDKRWPARLRERGAAGGEPPPAAAGPPAPGICPP